MEPKPKKYITKKQLKNILQRRTSYLESRIDQIGNYQYDMNLDRNTLRFRTPSRSDIVRAVIVCCVVAATFKYFHS